MKENAHLNYNYFRSIYNSFQQCGASDPLQETFSLFDLLCGGVLTQTDKRILEHREINFQDVVRRKDNIPMHYVVGMTSTT